MDWKDEELADAMSCGSAAAPKDIPVHALPASSLRAIMTRAVELAAARGGTMTAGALAECNRLAGLPPARNGWDEDTVKELLQHISVLGARNAVLEKEVASLRETARLNAEERDSARERLCAAEEGNRERVRRAQQAETQVAAFSSQIQFMRTTLERAQSSESVWRKRIESAADELADVGAGEVGRIDIVTRVRMLKARCATLSAAGQVLSAHVDKTEQCDHCDRGNDVARCTCMDDVPSMPGHPERVKERSDAVKALSEKILPGPDVVDGGPGSRGLVRVVSEQARSMADSYAEGAEAMRAACWEEVSARLTEEGFCDADAVYNKIKRAIEGATP